MKRRRLFMALCLAALAVGACSKPTAPPLPSSQASLPTPPAQIAPDGEQKLRDEANRNYYRPTYQPAERKSYRP